MLARVERQAAGGPAAHAGCASSELAAQIQPMARVYQRPRPPGSNHPPTWRSRNRFCALLFFSCTAAARCSAVFLPPVELRPPPPLLLSESSPSPAPLRAPIPPAPPPPIEGMGGSEMLLNRLAEGGATLKPAGRPPIGWPGTPPPMLRKGTWACISMGSFSVVPPAWLK